MTATLAWLVTALGLTLLSAAACATVPRRSVAGVLGYGTAAASVAFAVCGATAVAADGAQVGVLWSSPLGDALSVRIDHLGGYFLLVIGAVTAPVCIFSVRYLVRYAERHSLRVFAVWFCAMLVSIAGVVIAGDVLTFLVAWEVMAVSTAVLVAFEHEGRDATRAAWLMFAASELGMAAFLAALFLLSGSAGSLQFSALEAHAGGVGGGTAIAVFLLSFFGFATKAGLVPVNFWLPRAHPVAPGTISAVLSAVVLDLGVYGIMRVDLKMIPTTVVGLGLVMLIAGGVSAILGIVYAAIHKDLKTVLAHSSIENIGLVVAGLGAGFVFQASGQAVLAGVAWTVALLQMTNHSVYKALLFLGASAVDATTGTRDLDRLGGLVRRMPGTALAFLIGALSIAALPPFSGFTSEWLLLQTLLRSVVLSPVLVKVTFAVVGIVLALTAALAVTCFVRVFAMGFLGHARSREAVNAREVPWSMRMPMAVLAAACFLIGIGPTLVIPVVARAVGPPAGAAQVTSALIPPFFSAPSSGQLPAHFRADFNNIGATTGSAVLPGQGMVILHQGGSANPVVFAIAPFYLALVFAGMLAIAWLAVRLATRRRTRAPAPVWAGGVRRLLPSMTYTATGFARPVRVIFQALVHPQDVREERETAHEHFTEAIRRSEVESHIVDHYIVRPLAWAVVTAAVGVSRLHNGRLPFYSGLLLATLVGVLIASIIH